MIVLMRPLLLAVLLIFGLLSPVRAGTAQTGIASWYGPGNGVAMPFCTWTYRHVYGCGAVAITSLDTGLSTIAPVIDFCQCYVGTPQERIIDLQLDVVATLGLDPARGLYSVTIELISDIPNTSMQTKQIAPHWLRGE